MGFLHVRRLCVFVCICQPFVELIAFTQLTIMVYVDPLLLRSHSCRLAVRSVLTGSVRRANDITIIGTYISRLSCGELSFREFHSSVYPALRKVRTIIVLNLATDGELLVSLSESGYETLLRILLQKRPLLKGFLCRESAVFELVVSPFVREILPGEPWRRILCRRSPERSHRRPVSAAMDGCLIRRALSMTIHSVHGA